jgi:hypothetical protein
VFLVVHLAAGLVLLGLWPHSISQAFTGLPWRHPALFYPYRDFVASALREGRIAFWNPYLFGGAPMLANQQAAVLYPLHWPLIWLPVTKQVYWSARSIWLLGAGATGCCSAGWWRVGRPVTA